VIEPHFDHRSPYLRDETNEVSESVAIRAGRRFVDDFGRFSTGYAHFTRHHATEGSPST
jgi:hypothetical protein